MMVATLAAGDHVYSVAGERIRAHGAVSLARCGRRPGRRTRLLIEFARAAALCNDAALHDTSDGWRVEGDPMEGALVALAGKITRQWTDLRGWSRTDSIPFDAEHRYMAVLHHDHEGQAEIHVKGAPEARACPVPRPTAAEGGVEPLDPTTGTAWSRNSPRRPAGDRARTRSAVPRSTLILTPRTSTGSLTLIGLVGLIDPPRPRRSRPSPTASLRASA